MRANGDKRIRKLKNLISQRFGLIGASVELHYAALTALAVKIAAAGLGFGSQILLAQVLGAEQYGLYSYFWVWIMVGGLVTSFGLSEAATRFIAEYRDTGKYDLAWGFIWNALSLTLITSIGLAVIGISWAFIFQQTLPEGYVTLIVLALLCLPLMALQELMEGYALSFSWTGLGHIPPYVLRQALIMVLVLAFVLAGNTVTAATALLCVLLALLLSAGGQLVIFLHRTAKILPKAPLKTERRHWMKTALPMLLASGFQLCLTFSDIIILGMFLDSSTVALYFAATRITSQIAAVQFSVLSAVAQKMSSFKATDNLVALRELVHNSVRWIFWPTLAITVGILVAGWPLLWLFGAEFTSAYSLLPILALGLLVRASTGGAEDALKMVGYEYAEFKAKAVSTGLNLVLNFSLIPWLGMHGAAIATTVSLIVYSIMIELMVRRYLGTSSFIGSLKRV
ncbi:lipopolysaccharide biosynthesis protein [Labrenzia sp. PHM005]|uniref:lipopolysaccharide biosynthesis protein n=1 Tax=Labrenzia sp. PHM005 TaxID=2590016 RepID=UPI00113FE5D5|nr:oligosaccharide flippase family protein [Labrenzia sp. PHM005]QDG74555.1 hypothetical protein FJ695_00975 [Labrenzia sp. PHM005]